MIFEGEYLNGKRIGKGKEYYNSGILKFEGEYLSGEQWNGNGYVREYNNFGHQMEFEGEYLNGKRNGKGKEYDNDGKLKYAGEYLNGERNGKGKEYDNDGKLKYSKVNIQMEKNGMEKGIILIVKLYMKLKKEEV